MALSVNTSTGQPATVTVNQDLIRQIKQDKAKAQANAFFDKVNDVLIGSQVAVSVVPVMVSFGIEESISDSCKESTLKDKSLAVLKASGKSDIVFTDCINESTDASVQAVHTCIKAFVR